MDEAASALRMQIESVPREVDDIEREVRTLEIARQALLREKDEASQKGYKTPKRNSQKKEQAQQLKERWLAEKNGLKDIKDKRTEAEQLRHR